MDSVFLVIGIVAVTSLAGVTISVARWIFARGQLRGIREAVHELTTGVSSNYEHSDKPVPERVAKCIEQMKEQIAKSWGAREKCRAFSAYFRDLGYVMGEAAWQDGFEAGQRFTDPREGEIRLDLSLKELMKISWLAHFGFENMVLSEDGPFSFKDEKDAEEATRAIGRIEFYIPKEQRDQSDPHALAINRQIMIWNRWPSEKQIP